MHTQSANAELKSSRFRFTALELRSSELGEALGKELAQAEVYHQSKFQMLL